MLDIQTQQLIQSEVQKQVQEQLKARDRLNASGSVFHPNTGLGVNGLNVQGEFGNNIFHNLIRLNPKEQTIASGVIKAVSSSILIYTQSSASTDDLDTIIPDPLVYAGDEIIMLRAADDADTVIVKHNTGNILLVGSADFSMDGVNDVICLRWDALQLKWVELFRNDDIPYGALTLTDLIVNADISASAAIAISKTTLGTYTAPTNWTPTLGAIGAMTFTGTSVNRARYTQIGKYVFFQISCSGTTGGVANLALTATLPISVASSGIVSCGGFINDGGTAIAGFSAFNGTGIDIYRYDGGNWSLGAGRAFQINGFYEVA